MDKHAQYSNDRVLYGSAGAYRAPIASAHGPLVRNHADSCAGWLAFLIFLGLVLILIMNSGL